MAIDNNQAPKILTVGAAIQDVFLSNSPALESIRVEATHDSTELELGAKFDVNKVDLSTGGGATNAAVTFARQGLQAFRQPRPVPRGQAQRREGMEVSFRVARRGQS